MPKYVKNIVAHKVDSVKSINMKMLFFFVYQEK